MIALRRAWMVSVVTAGGLVMLSGMGPEAEPPKTNPGLGTAKVVPVAPRRDREAKEKATVFTPEREAAALAFVKRHHPQLAPLLAKLKAHDIDQYEKAIGDLFLTSERLASLLTQDRRRYELAVEAWTCKSKVELLTARMAGAPSAEVETELKRTLQRQIDVEIRQAELEREQAEARVRRLNETIDRLKAQQTTLVEDRFRRLARSVQRGRATTATAVAKDKTKASERTKTKPNPAPPAGGVPSRPSADVSSDRKR